VSTSSTRFEWLFFVLEKNLVSLGILCRETVDASSPPDADSCLPHLFEMSIPPSPSDAVNFSDCNSLAFVLELSGPLDCDLELLQAEFSLISSGESYRTESL
jgi:hypothetical protein